VIAAAAHSVTVRATGPDQPLVVLLHGRGADEQSIAPLANLMTLDATYVALRGPIALATGGFTWFDNRGIGRPVPESLSASMDWFDQWLDELMSTSPNGRSVILIGYSGGCAFAGGLVLTRPDRYRAVAFINGTLPFDTAAPTIAERLSNVDVLWARAKHDEMIPNELLDRSEQFLRNDSAAHLTTHRSPGGHELDQSTIDALGEWLSALA
jgi:phospholipase/carboxylesterase